MTHYDNLSEDVVKAASKLCSISKRPGGAYVCLVHGHVTQPGRLMCSAVERVVIAIVKAVVK